MATEGAHNRGTYHARYNFGTVGGYAIYIVCLESSAIDNRACPLDEMS